MPTEIRANGSKWYGEKPDGIPTLCNRLRSHPLCRWFVTEGAVRTNWNESLRYFGNFEGVSAVFDIVTDDCDDIAMLDAALSAQMATFYSDRMLTA